MYDAPCPAAFHPTGPFAVHSARRHVERSIGTQQRLTCARAWLLGAAMSLACCQRGSCGPAGEAARAAEAQTAAKTVSTASYRRVSIGAESAVKGVFDPSVEYDRVGAIGWMAYSALEAPADRAGKVLNPQFVHTGLAQSMDHGKTWSFVKRLNESREDTIQLGGRTVRGAWWHEVPSLLFDPDDRQTPWKLFWMKYFAVPTPYYEPPQPSGEPTVRIVQHMWIAYKAAASPAELDAAREVLLLDAGISARPEDRARQNVNALHSSLRDRKAYTEPGTLVHDGRLYLSLDSFTGPEVSEFRLILLSSKDRGSSWEYVGQLLDPSDAAWFGYRVLGASSLAEDGGRTFLLVSPMDSKGHHGTYVFEFDDVSQAKLRRDSRGHLLVHKYLPVSVPLIAGHVNAGESSFHRHNTAGGVVMPQSDIDSAPALGQLFNTGILLNP